MSYSHYITLEQYRRQPGGCSALTRRTGGGYDADVSTVISHDCINRDTENHRHCPDYQCKRAAAEERHVETLTYHELVGRH